MIFCDSQPDKAKLKWLEHLRILPTWIGEMLDVEAFAAEKRVGHVTCLLNSDDRSMRICDLVVVGREEKLTRRIKHFLRWRCWSMQRLGIGSKLLRDVIERAQGGGVLLLHGAVVQKDLNERPWLPDYYRGHGFKVTEPNGDPGDPPGTVHRIEMTF